LSFTNIELVLGSSSGDLLIADDSGVAFRGRDGDDTLTGGAGDDFLIAGNFDGQSNPISRGGNAVINGGGGNDDIWLNIGDDRADGGTGNDTFHVQGNLGNDDIGNDTIGGGDGIDEINLVNFSPIVVDLGAGTMTGGGPQGTATISFTGIENFTTGGVATVIGNSSANDLRVTGQGTIDGAGGNDTLSGGNGDGDIFIFGQAPGTANSDFITNFQSASDTLELDARVMPALGASGRFAMGDARFFAAAGATSGHDADDRIVYNSSTGNVFYDADGSGAGAAQLIATLQQGAALTAADVVVANGGAPGGQLIQGTSGDDTLGGTNGNDTLDGLAGNDVVDGGLGTDLVRGGSGNDRLKDRADSVASAPDTLDGGLGNDIFDLLANPSRPHATVLVDAGGVDTVWANHNFTLPAGIENLTLFEGFAGQGNELDNTIVAFGNLPNYSLEGAAGNDTLIGAPDSTDGMTGGAGSDVFAFLRLSSNASGFGGGDNVFDFVSGTDTLQLDNTGFANLGAPGRFSPGDERFFLGNAAHDASDRVIFADATGRLLYDPDGTGPAQALMIARIQGLVATDIVVVGEAAPPPPASIAGTAGNDSLTGTAGNDSILGLAGSDTINALGGNDTLDGGAGIDNLNGGFGNDTYIVGAGDVLSDTDGIDTVVSDANWSLADGFENLTLTGTANLTATGNNAANVLVGNSGNNFFNPRGGDDTIQAGAGNDLIRLGGGGVPTYGTKVIDGGAGFDTLDFGGFARSAFSVNLATGSLGGGGEAGQGTARLAGIEAVIGDGFNDALVGSAGADSLNGGGGNDAVSGGAGNDTLEGGVGIDTLNGGAGLDSFVFHQAPPAGGVDFITDFTSGSDKLLFDNAAFTALGADGAFAAGDGRFLAGPGRSSGSDASDRLIYDTTAGTLWYDADGSGQGSSQQIATLVGHPALAATDITVI
jgi:Ca2+-binding RTX toxin-like protein